MNWRDKLSSLPAAAVSEGRSQRIARCLVQHAARNAPAELSERLEEEWLADLSSRHGALAQLRFGLGCCWATRVIAHDYSAVQIPAATAATAATGQKTMTSYAASNDSVFFSRRSSIFLLIIALHGFFIYALKTGLAHPLLNALPVSTVVSFPVDPQKPIEAPPAIVQPILSEPSLNNPIPVPTVEEPLDSNPIQDLAPRPTEQILPPVASDQQHVVNRILGGPGKGFPNTDDFYPSASRRMSEEGIATARVCVDEKGKLIEEPTIAESSGSTRLNESALKLARAGSGHYRASTEDGWPVSSCYSFRIKFQLRD